MSKQKSYLLALSGGADSVCLFHLLRISGFHFQVFHCNYHLRGNESDGDEQFVRDLCKKYGLSCFVHHFDTEAIVRSEKGNVQEVARRIRYDWFREEMNNRGLDGILTAHHFNDSLETSLFNFARGTNIQGLSGIPKAHEGVLRPLMGFSRSDIEAFLEKNGYSYRTDSSNLSEKYSRNKIRLSILPQFTEIFEDAEKRMERSLENIQSANTFVSGQIGRIRKELFEDWAYGKRIRLELLRELKPLEWVLEKIFSPYGFHNGKEIRKLMHASSGKLIASDAYRLIRDREFFILTDLKKEDEEFIFDKDCKILEKPVFIKVIQDDDTSGEENFDVEFDCDKFEFPLTLRTWRRGDYFYPKGMSGKKKLSDFYSDLKLSLPEKENTWLLCSGNEIMYIVGLRQDRRFLVDGNTTKRMKIQIEHQTIGYEREL